MNINQKVRWKPSAGMDDRPGTIVPPPIGSRPLPPNASYVLWKGLQEPMFVWDEDIETTDPST